MQEVYGVDLDQAMAGAHTPAHMAALVAQLPPDARVFKAGNRDAAWRLEHVLLASIGNTLNAMAYGMSDRRKRGAPPKPMGPSWLTDKGGRALESRAMPVEELIEELEMPRSEDG